MGLFGSGESPREALALLFKIAATPLVYGACSDRTAASPSRLQQRLGFAATFPQDVSTVPSRVLEALRMTEGPGAADLKFLRCKQQARPGTSDEKAAPESEILVPFVFRSSYKGC